MSADKIEHYILGETIGKGGSAKVKVARHEFTGNMVAVKIMSKVKLREMRLGARVKREINLLRYFNHPNIIKMYEVLETQSHIFLITEYASEGELSRLIPKDSRLSEREAKFYFRQIVAAIEYCHSNLIAHRDLKPENILMDEYNTIKIADFGLANLMRDGKAMKTDCGSPNYVAPEVLSRKRYCGSETDIWSCGIVLFVLLAGYLPFDDANLQTLFKKIMKAQFSIPGHFSKEAKDLIEKMLNKNPMERIKIHEIKQHPWMAHTDVLYLDPRKLRPFHGEFENMKKQTIKKIQEMGFNFGGFGEQKIKEAIERRKEFSFVVGFNLILDEFKKKVISGFVKAQKEKTFEKEEEEEQQKGKNSQDSNHAENCSERTNQISTMMDNFSEFSIETENSVMMSTLFDSNLKMVKKNSPKQAKEESQSTRLPADPEGWHYGLKYKLRVDIILDGITETLTELNTMYFVKSGPYKIKCFHHLYKESFSPTIFQQGHRETNCGGLALNKKEKDKFSKEEISFKIQIFKVPNKNEYVIDIQRVSGHTLVFLDYCQKFAQVLERKLHKH